MLGEHTEAVLREVVGCTDEEIQALKTGEGDMTDRRVDSRRPA